MLREPDPHFRMLDRALAGRYVLERRLGRGGMGVVFLARELSLDRRVAIKLLLPAKAVDPVARERFLVEARTAAQLSHPNIVPIFAVDELTDVVFFAMAYVEGQTLGQRVRERGPLRPEEGARLLRDVAWALAHAHERGVVHRDVKPDNILLDSATGRAVVSDFGIARVGAWRRDYRAARGGGDCRVHEPGAGERARGGCAERSLLAGGGRLLRAVGPAAVRRTRLLRDAGAAHRGAAAAARLGGARSAAAAGAGHRPLSLEGAGGTLHERRAPR